MNILSVTALAIPDVKVIRFARFTDHRGYFTEPFRRSDIDRHAELGFLRALPLPQMNESWSRAGVVRGLHFQWNPGMGKLLRTVQGRMIDIFLDIRHGSPTVGQAAMYELAAADDRHHDEWIWVPPGFAHGNFFTVESRIEYLCSDEYNPACEAGISPLSPDIDWTHCPQGLRDEFARLIRGSHLLSDKDRDAPTLGAWMADPRSQNFSYQPA